MGDSNRVSLAYAAEATYGTTPDPAATLQNLRFVSESLAQESNVATSAEIRADRQVADVVRTGYSVKGDVNGELSYGTWDSLLEAALCSAAWSDPAPAAMVTAIETATSGTVSTSAYILNGTTERSFIFERAYQDIANEFALFNGVAVDGLNLDVKAESIVTIGMNLIGQKETSGTATAGDGSNTAANTNAVLNSSEDVVSLLEGGSAVSLSAFSLKLTNNLRTKPKVTQAYPFDLGLGVCNVTGSVTVYFESKTLLDKYLAFTSSSLAIVFKDPAGQGYMVELPAVKYTKGTRVAGGQDQDIMVELDFTAKRDSTTDSTIRVARFTLA